MHYSDHYFNFKSPFLRALKNCAQAIGLVMLRGGNCPAQYKRSLYCFIVFLKAMFGVGGEF